MGKSGRRFLDAIVSGESNPEELAKLSDPRLKAPREQIVEALRGIVTPHHRAAIKRHLAMYDAIQEMIAEIDSEVGALLEPFCRQAELLDTIPGIDVQAARVIISEIGVDMSRFPSAAHLVGWACLSPRNDESAGKKRNTRIGNGGQWLKATLIQAAWAATRKKESHLRALYLRIKGKRGPKKAIIAVAAEMLRSAWYMLTRNEEYKDIGDGFADPVQKERVAHRLVKKLKKLGYEVKVDLPAAVAA